MNIQEKILANILHEHHAFYSTFYKNIKKSAVPILNNSSSPFLTFWPYSHPQEYSTTTSAWCYYGSAPSQQQFVRMWALKSVRDLDRARPREGGLGWWWDWISNKFRIKLFFCSLFRCFSLICYFFAQANRCTAIKTTIRNNALQWECVCVCVDRAFFLRPNVFR